MKIVFLIFILLNYSDIYSSQTIGEQLDSVALISRERADVVLSSFDYPNSYKLLYSINDRDFWVIVKKETLFKEYYLRLDESDEIIFTRPVKSRRKDFKLLTRAFDLEMYHSNFITSLPDAKFIHGYPSYFVIKDSDGTRYGEYSLSSLTIPTPIDADVYFYLTRRLIEQKNKK